MVMGWCLSTHCCRVRCLRLGHRFSSCSSTMQGEKEVTKRFDSTIVADSTMFAKAFASVGLPITIKPELPRQFMASYIQLLQAKSETLSHRASIRLVAG